MNRTTFIIIGIVTVFILLAVWVFMLFFGTGTGADTFANFGFGDTTDDTYVEPEEDDIDEAWPTVDLGENSPLRQLTTSPIVGYREVVTDASSTPTVYYVAAGTGHIFTIDVENGREERISATTIPSASKAAITPNAGYAMIQAGEGIGRSYRVLEIGTSTSEVTIDEDVITFASTEENLFIYAAQTLEGAAVKMYNPRSKTTQQLFSIPFREVAIDWGSSVDGPHFVYPKASSQMESYVYRVDGRSFSRTPVDGFGMSAQANANYVVFSRQNEGSYQTYTYNNLTNEIIDGLLPVIPEKCTHSDISLNMFVCAADGNQTFDSRMPDIWYSGELQNADSLWQFDLEANEGNWLINTESVSGRKLDIINLHMSHDDEEVYFMNKNDLTLWVYDIGKR